MTYEAKLQTKILEHLHKKGHVAWKVVTSQKGIPDLVGCTKGGIFLAIEVKANRNRLSKIQAYVLANLKELGGCVGAVYGWQNYLEFYYKNVEANAPLNNPSNL